MKVLPMDLAPRRFARYTGTSPSSPTGWERCPACGQEADRFCRKCRECEVCCLCKLRAVGVHLALLPPRSLGERLRRNLLWISLAFLAATAALMILAILRKL